MDPSYFSRRFSSASTASRMNLDRACFLPPTSASTRARSSGVICTLTGLVPFGPIGGLPIARAVAAELVAGMDKTAPFSVDVTNSAVYINRAVYFGKKRSAP
jgi:hypothetical protein